MPIKTGFSYFFRTASDKEKYRVIKKAIQKANKEQRDLMDIQFCKTSERNSKSHSYAFYLDKIKELKSGRTFAMLEAFCTDGDIRPTHPYQWRATSTLLSGDDEPFEGVGWTPLEALYNLYKEMKERKR